MGLAIKYYIFYWIVKSMNTICNRMGASKSVAFANSIHIPLQGYRSASIQIGGGNIVKVEVET